MSTSKLTGSRNFKRSSFMREVLGSSLRSIQDSVAKKTRIVNLCEFHQSEEVWKLSAFTYCMTMFEGAQWPPVSLVVTMAQSFGGMTRASRGNGMPWQKAMALQELTETSRLYLRCITCVAPLTLLLFANLLSETMETWEIHTLLKCRNGKHDEPDEPWDFDGFCGCSLFGQT